MSSESFKSISSFELITTQINELREMKADLEKLKNELSMAQIKYHQRIADYEVKLEQLHLQIDKVNQEQDEKEANLLNATKEWLETKKKLESSIMSPKQRVKLNVGGDYFETTIKTLTKYTERTTSYFKALFSGEWHLNKDPKDESIFIDRDGQLFGYILQYLRTGKITIDLECDLLRRDLIIEAQFYSLQNLVDLLNINQPKNENNIKSNPQPTSKALYLDTKILSFNDQIELNKLNGWDNQQWQLIYRASRDGYTAKAFHQFCDGCFPTICVIRSKNEYIFGGFTTVSWGSTNEDKIDTLAFLFTLRNPYGIKPTKYPIRERAAGSAVGHYANRGPTFGSLRQGGFDLYLQSPFNAHDNRTFFPQTYQDTTKKGRLTFTDDPYFSCDDIEIFTFV